MQQRKFGRFDDSASLLGFGCMRLPTVDVEDVEKRDVRDIDEEKSVEMIRYAIDHGVNYVDTAYPYHGGGSEVLVGKALRDGYRERVKLATKCPTWKLESHDDFQRFFDEQLEKLQTDYLDVYLVHNLNTDFWKKAKEHDVFSFLDRIKAEGKVKYVGFSFHDNVELFKEIVDSYDWDLCQIQFNYVDQDYQAGLEGLHYAAERGLAVVVMEPLRGGKLAKNIPQEVTEMLATGAKDRSAAEWAFRWVANHQKVTTILSGMGNMDEVKENIAVLSNAAPNSLSEQELAVADSVKAFFDSRLKVKCTDCKYCMPCPSGVLIPVLFNLYNEAAVYGTWEDSKRPYKHISKAKKGADQCVECDQCESACPQNLSIIELLKEAHQALA